MTTELEFSKKLVDIENRIRNLERTPQPFLGDWYEILNNVEYVGVDTIEFVDTELDPRSFFSLGDKIRYKQGGDYKYAYIISVNSSQFQVSGGSDYVLTSAEITDLAVNISDTPNGHPIVFNFTITGSGGGSAVYTPGPSDAGQFYMVGPVCKVFFRTDGSFNTNDTFVVLLPIRASLFAVVTGINRLIRIANAGTPGTGMLAVNSATEALLWSSVSFGTFSSGIMGFETSVDFEYIVEG